MEKQELPLDGIPQDWLEPRVPESVRAMIDSAPERVARGAALLDILQPGWHERVRPKRLDVRFERSCILGQLYGSYRRGVVRICDLAKFYVRPWYFGYAYLVNPYKHFCGFEAECDRLNRAWLAEIEERNGGAA